MTDDWAGRDMNADDLGGERPDEETGEQRLHAAPDWLRLWSGKPRPTIKTKEKDQVNPYKIGDVVDVEAGPQGLWEYIGTGTVRDTGDWLCWVEMDNGERLQVHTAQLRLKCRVKE